MSWSALLVSLLLVPSSLAPQARGEAPADTVFYAVSYVETATASSSKAAALLKQYRDASAKRDGYVGIDLFEQIGRPGHFVVFETWRDQKAFDARDASALKQLRDALQPIRVSDWDQRPYKTLSVQAPRAAATAQSIIVISHVDIAPNSPGGAQASAMLQRIAETSRQEPGNLRYDVVQHTMRGNHFTVVEGWRNQQGFDAHVEAAHTKQYRDTLQPMTGSPLDERVYKAIN